jgi:hypothetical protein
MSHGIWHDLLHLTAAVVLSGVGGLFVLASWRERRRAVAAGRTGATLVDRIAPASADSPKASMPAATAVLGAVLAIAAAAIHLAAAPAHIEELGALGWGFVLAAVLGAAWALAWGIAQTRGIAVAGIAIHAPIVVAWAVTRTLGLPLGPEAGVPEPVGVPDAAATLFELLLVALLAVRATGVGLRLGGAIRRAPSLAPIALVPAVGVVFLATTLAVSLALSHDHGAGEPHADAPHGAARVIDPGH